MPQPIPVYVRGHNMKKLVLFLCLLFWCSGAWATTWYIRTDGSTNTNCTGQTDAAYPGSGTNQNCALNSPQWTFPGTGENTTTKAQPGDTVIIDGSDEGGTGQYRIGCQNATNCRDASVNLTSSANCDSTYPYDCGMGSINPVTVIGCTATGCGCAPSYSGGKWITTCTHPRPQLWGAGEIFHVLTLNSSSNGAVVQDLEITDHAQCAHGFSDYACDTTASGLGARDGISVSGLDNATFKNLWIHGMSYRAFYGHVTGNVLFDNVNMDKNPFAGWDNDDGSGTTGNPTFQNHFKITYSGCIEAYPLTGSTSNTRTDVLECIDQNATGYGDAIGTHDGTNGTWSFSYGDISHNVQDGIDLLHSAGNGSINVYRVIFNGNNGQNVKSSLKTVNVENASLIHDCDYFSVSGIPLASGFSGCRANGSSIVLGPNQASSVVNVKNTTMWGGNIMVESGTTSFSCDGTQTVNMQNDILYGSLSQTGSGQQTTTYYCDGSDGNGTGPCCNGSTKVAVSYSHDDIYNTKDSPSGTSLITTDPHFGQGDHVNTSPNSDTFDFSLTTSSTNVIGQGDTSITLNGTSNDVYDNSRGVAWDLGAVQYGSTPSGSCSSNGTSCIVNSDCCSNICDLSVCSSVSTTGLNMSLSGGFSINGAYSIK